MATFIDTINGQLDESESEMSENIKIETDFPQKRVRKVKKQLDDQTHLIRSTLGLQIRDIKWMLSEKFII